MMMVLFVVLLLVLPSPSIQQQSSDEIKFDLKLVNVGSTNAEFQIDDDNQTTINYEITYSANSGKIEYMPPDDLHAEQHVYNSISMIHSIKVQTNSRTLADKQTELMQNAQKKVEAKKIEDSGENYTSDEIEQAKTAKYETEHRFNVFELEPNRNYEINLTILAKRAHLSAGFYQAAGQTIDAPSSIATRREFNFKFTTTYDWNEAAHKACNASQYDSESSCYQPGSECTQCKSTCFQVPNPTKNDQNDEKKLVLCEACPCDKLRSTGECTSSDQDTDTDGQSNTVDTNNSHFLQAKKLKCKQCITPYTGKLCNECESEGYDYYRNEAGECSACDCNGNSAYDLLDSNSRASYKRRKCQPITGMCNDCQFNTTGRHCHECKDGFYGNALRRTCRLIIQIKPSDKTSNNLDYLNKKYTYKTLALFSMYIFCIVGLAILTFLCIRAKYYQDQSYKINTPADEMGNGGDDSSDSGFILVGKLMSHCRNGFKYLSDATKNQRAHLAIYLGFNPVASWRRFRFLVPHSSSSSTHATSRSAGGIYTAASSRDGDRLNLAECAVFDDSLFDDSPNNIYQPVSNGPPSTRCDNNPYKTLTIDS